MVAEVRGFGAKLPMDANGELLAKSPMLLEICKNTLAVLKDVLVYTDWDKTHFMRKRVESLIKRIKEAEEV